MSCQHGGGHGRGRRQCAKACRSSYLNVEWLAGLLCCETERGRAAGPGVAQPVSGIRPRKGVMLPRYRVIPPIIDQPQWETRILR